MYTRIQKIWLSYRSSFWFVPSVMMVFASISAIALVWLDSVYGKSIIRSFPALEMSAPSARAVLSSIVGAMVTSTGVVFSITIVALSLSSSHFGSRLIRTYRNRKTTHFTLGIFVSTSLFCILVLASIREVGSFEFVPLSSVAVGIVLTVICLITLVYYIHDMSRAIQAPNVIQSSANDLDDAITRLFPESVGKPSQQRIDDSDIDDSDIDDSDSENCSSSVGQSIKLDKLNMQPPIFKVPVNTVGYLQAIEHETLLKIACEHQLVVKLLIRPGDFLHKPGDLAEVFAETSKDSGASPEFSSDELEELADAVCTSIQRCMIVGAERTHMQDVRHAFNELVDIAVRALSPGINDPFTAINCVDRIHAALQMLHTRDLPSIYRYDEDGELRLIAYPVCLEECLQDSLGVIKSYAGQNNIVSSRIADAFSALDFADSDLASR